MVVPFSIAFKRGQQNLKTVSQCIQIASKRFVKRKYPINREEEKNLPIFQYAEDKFEKRVYVWGLAEHGALGNQVKRGHRKNKPLAYMHRPTRLSFAEYYKVVDVTCGYGFTVFAVNTKEKYKVFGTGINTDSQIGYQAPRRDHPLGLVVSPAPIELPTDNKITQVAAGRAHSVVVSEAGEAFTFGNNAYGQCGRRIVEDEKYTGNQIVNSIKNLDGVPIKSVVCGQDHSMFITLNGEVYACGWSADGQTGLGHFDTHWKPTKLQGDIAGENIVKISCAADCVIAINDKGQVFGWGNTEYGQLFCNDIQQLSVPRHLKKCEKLGKAVDVASGGSACLLVNDSGDVFVWGYGILGRGPKVDKEMEPALIPATLFGRNEFQPESRVTAVTAGISHFGAISNYGDLYMWGRNKGGCLGLGHINDQFFPLRVSVGLQVIKASCGVDHTAALCQSFC